MRNALDVDAALEKVKLVILEWLQLDELLPPLCHGVGVFLRGRGSDQEVFLMKVGIQQYSDIFNIWLILSIHHRVIWIWKDKNKYKHVISYDRCKEKLQYFIFLRNMTICCYQSMDINFISRDKVIYKTKSWVHHRVSHMSRGSLEDP